MSEIKVGIIGGSGLGRLLSAENGRRHDIQTPFGSPSEAIVETEWEGLGVLLLSRHGPGHLIPPTNIPFRANVFAMKQLGCTHIIASGACGSLRQEFKPKDLVIPDQIIDKTHRRAATFFEKAAVHVEFAEPFCPILRQILIEQGKTDASPAVHDRGCYVCMEGPAFSTRAESLMHRLWGGDLIGMTAMPEAKLAREAEIPYAMIGIVTDYDSWKSPAPVGPGGPPPPAETAEPTALLAEILANLQAASANAMELIRRSLRRIAADPARLLACPAREALKLAIWSEKSRIPAEEIQRLSPLWGKYFG
ncbi:MAG TPA: S-methyl-5'-thioadenosine phosphorylase [Tepidisphaeraceae bacterium]|jgi:5'-methylthioadenosine phosphorylase|nr:S-methyl-5'-thioadenosine phosphorylase [Tepidisphaeraceae bacterium]